MGGREIGNDIGIKADVKERSASNEAHCFGK